MTATFYPSPESVKITDEFWASYLEKVRYIMMPYVFKKFEETGYIKNFYSVAQKDGKEHIGHSFSDGLVLESLRGACDFLAQDYDPFTDAYADKLIEAVCAAARAGGGFLSTYTTQNCPGKEWGHNGGDIVYQHDLYNHGTLIEAGISHYKATKKTTLLKTAVDAANLICSEIGKPPKKNIIPGHSLPEEAFVKLYRLFRDEKELSEFARENNVNHEEYLDMAQFWYDARGSHEGRCLCEKRDTFYNQDHAPFNQQDKAVGHSVRAMLCYLGAAAIVRETGRTDYMDTLRKLWDNVVLKKLHISGGIGARSDIEGFDLDYNLPNKAYLETCAGIALAFWNGEMNLIEQNSKYFDCFERSLYNNILSAVGEDFKHFYYENPLCSDGSLSRWDWHGCPCCPPMLLKIFSTLGCYIYSVNNETKTLNINMHIDSVFKGDNICIDMKNGFICADSMGAEFTIKIRIPEYAENFVITKDGKITESETENGYCVIKGIFTPEKPLKVSFDTPPRRVAANPKVEENNGKVAFMHGPYVMCAEGIDNGGNTDFEIAENPCISLEGENIHGKTSQGKDFCLIPYYKWSNRGSTPMAVWFCQQNMKDMDENEIKDRLYITY